MRKIIPFVLLLLLFSCTNTLRKNIDNKILKDSIQIIDETQSVEALLNEMSQKPLPENYEMVGDLKTDELKFMGFGMGDLAHYHFADSNGKDYDFNGNNTDVELLVDAEEYSEENGGYDPNPNYLNKNFRVVWRTVKLNKEPSDIIETYYQEYNEIIYLKLLH